MRNDRGNSRFLVAVVLVSAVVSLGFGSASTAERKVREGLQLFAKGEFDAAGKAFAEADVAEPENQPIRFDRACVFAAVGELEQARDLFQQAALARDTDLAARSHYNLGTLSAAEGRAALGDEPVAATPERRQQGLSLLLSAAGHYRDCLGLAADHSDARHNLELIRLFIKHIEAQWEARDREKTREETGLLDFLSMIRRRQAALRSTLHALDQQADSPQRRQATHEAAAEQAALREEMEPLQAKISEQFQASQQSPASGGSPGQDPTKNDQLEQAEKLLTQLVNEASSLMEQAQSAISAGLFGDARGQQRDVLDQLNQIFMAVAPFSNVLERATEQQQQLVETSEALTRETEAAPNDDAQPIDDGKSAMEPSEPSTSVNDDAEIEWPELEWQQARVSDWSRMLSLKARSELPSVEAQLQTAGTPEPEVDPSPASTIDDPVKESGTAGDPNAQLQALKQSLEKAIELAPKVEQCSAAAALQLAKSDAAAALPEQQQAQELLREIAQPLAQENQQQDNQPAGDENNSDQNQDSGQPPPQPNNDQAQQQTGESPQERAMSALRRARQREREHRDLTKQLQQMTGGRVGVDRDW